MVLVPWRRGSGRNFQAGRDAGERGNRARSNRARLWLEPLETRLAPAAIGDAVYPLLHELTTANQDNFFVYQDADSGLNHGFPSGFFAGDGTTDYRDDLVKKIQLDAAGIDDPAS